MTKTQQRINFFHDISIMTIAAYARGIYLLPHCFYRTQKQQDILFGEGKSKTKHSKHQDWLAIDFVIIRDGKAIWVIDEDYKWLGALWEKMGHTWGGNFSFRDGCHFEN